jgi:hypothetical protein
MTCSTATTNTPICIVYTVPLGGGGGAFSTQAITDAFNQCVALGGTEADCSTYANRGSFEGHPPAGYTTSNPLMIQITWDVSVAPLGLATPVYYQRDGLAPKLLSTCDKNKKGGIKYPIHPDPCLKAIKILGKTKDTSKQCKPQSACFGDVQAQILLSSNPTDGGIYHK